MLRAAGSLCWETAQTADSNGSSSNIAARSDGPAGETARVAVGPHVTVDLDAGRLILRTVGEFDLASARLLADALRDACSRRVDVVIDLGEVVFLDAFCFGMIIDTADALQRASRRLHVINVPRGVKRMAQALHRDDLLAV